MKELLEFIIKSIVGSPEKVSITEEASEITSFIIKVPQEEIGLVIGQQGKVIKAIKSLLLVLSKGERFALEVQEA
ncbi:MAG: KH domain-containing protein [Patescibacteria group bacterium]|nr:KH domain-containing protein [Patescibacteria group bacterium]